MVVETSSTSEAPGLSRRRLVQGAVWATPAVLIATAAPAAAASPPRLGGLVLTTFRGFQSASTITVSTYVSYVGDGAPSPDYPVSTVTATISVPTARVGTGAGSTASAGWTYTSRTDGPTNSVFLFTRTGTNLSATNNITSQLVAVLPKLATNRAAFNVTLQAFGKSGPTNTTTVSSAAQSVTIAAVAALTIPSGLTATRDPFGTSPRYAHYVAPVLNSSTPTSAPVVGLLARITVPTAAVASGTPSATAGTWTYASPPVVSGSNTIFTFNFTPGTLNASATATPASFRIPFPAFLLDTPTVSITFEGRSPTALDALITVSASATIGL